MKHLFRPGAHEELSVQGQYTYTTREGASLAQELWERYRMAGADAEAWRAEWRDATGARTILAHTLLTSDGVERLKMRMSVNGEAAPTLTLTPDGHEILLTQGDAQQVVALPPVFGIVTPFLSLARLALPFDIGADRQELAMTYLLRADWQSGAWLHRPTKFGYFPLGLREVTLNGQTVKGKGWRMEVPGLPARSLWFDRNGTLLYAEIEGAPHMVVALTEYRTYG